VTLLDLSECVDISDDAFAEVADKCRALEEVTLTQCDLICASLGVLGRNCPKLTKLNIHGCRDLSSEDLTSIAEHCRQLTFLDISHCDRVDAASLAMLSNCVVLETLHLEQCFALDDDALVAITTTCVNLKVLFLLGCEALTDDSVTLIGERLPLLTDISLDGCQHITDTAARSIIIGCPLLRQLDFNSCVNLTDSSISLLDKHLPCLRQLRLAEVLNLTDASVNALLRRPTTVADGGRCGVEGKRMTRAPFTDELKEAKKKGEPLDEDTLLPPAKLMLLDLSVNANITNKAYQKIIRLHGATLTTLALGSSDIENSGVSLIADACPLLSALDFSACQLMSNFAAISVGGASALATCSFVFSAHSAHSAHTHLTINMQLHTPPTAHGDAEVAESDGGGGVERQRHGTHLQQGDGH
jgi:hypothetical protein